MLYKTNYSSKMAAFPDAASCSLVEFDDFSEELASVMIALMKAVSTSETSDSTSLHDALF
jgi:hypothetical protein